MKSLFVSAAASLVIAVSASAQSPPTTVPAAAPVMVGGTVVSGPIVSNTPATVPCLTDKCARPPCLPEVKPAKKTVYATVTREFCVPTRSLLDVLLSKCGMADDCDGPSGETRTKTLLVKKQVPKLQEACAKCKTAPVPMPAPVTSAPAVSVKP